MRHTPGRKARTAPRGGTYADNRPPVHHHELQRIALFSESFHPVQNGVTTSVLTLVGELERRGYTVRVYAPAHEAMDETETEVHRLPSFVSSLNPGYPLAYPFIPRLAVASEFMAARPDIVHTHTPFVLGLTGANLALSRHIPLVSTFHTLYSQYSHYVPLMPDSVTQNLLDHYLPWYYNRCAEIICPSNVAVRVLKAYGVERPMHAIPTGVPLADPAAVGPDVRASARNRLGIAATTPVMLYAGRISREKNLRLLLRVLARIRESVPEAVLLISGGGPDAAALIEDARGTEHADAIRFLGPTAHGDMNGLYAAADVFVFPSPSETQGLVIGEARAAGLPTVVVDAGGAPELVVHGEDGFRVPVEDHECFAARTIDVLTNAVLRERMSDSARTNAVSNTPEAMVQRILGVYHRARTSMPRLAELTAGMVAEEMDMEAVGQAIVEHGGEHAVRVPRD